MGKFVEIKERDGKKIVWKFFLTDETLEEAKARNSWRTDITDIVPADNSPDEAESGWLYDPDTGQFTEPVSTDPVEKQLADLDKRYRNKLNNLSLSYVGALMDGDTDNMERLKAERAAMVETYLSKRSRIVGS